MSSKKKIGIFGGTFNPPHIGHISAAKAFMEHVGLDELLIIPTFIPPHKDYLSDVDANTRLEMCKIAFSGLDNTHISDIEIKRGGRSYTYLTLEELSGDDRELYFLCGTDMILSIDTWKNPGRIFELAHICYVRRENDEENGALIEKKCNEYRENFSARIISIPVSVIEISSLKIRQALSKKEDMKKYLSDQTAKFILMKGLYK